MDTYVEHNIHSKFPVGWEDMEKYLSWEDMETYVEHNINSKFPVGGSPFFMYARALDIFEDLKKERSADFLLMTRRPLRATEHKAPSVSKS